MAKGYVSYISKQDLIKLIRHIEHAHLPFLNLISLWWWPGLNIHWLDRSVIRSLCQEMWPLIWATAEGVEDRLWVRVRSLSRCACRVIDGTIWLWPLFSQYSHCRQLWKLGGKGLHLLEAGDLAALCEHWSHCLVAWLEGLFEVFLGLRVGGVNIVVVSEGDLEHLLNSSLLGVSCPLPNKRLSKVTKCIKLAGSLIFVAPFCIAWIGAAEETASILLGLIWLIGGVDW